ncbi:MAG TPA: MFS transporter [Lachnoclostridium phytofermentans]|uniref:MFS transporter n=1 Tax=Lachnoclostridium phytofermentans TaxID=66219 RepID=A0A3D2X745_9FIRM|nr:MFS transporter [Lachnoclostridium sp.]HCL02714.1 MFS transporter [Lachnoclostridium phytofermentans]
MAAVEHKKRNWKSAFIILWSGQAISIFTSSVIQMAIIWYLTDTTGSAAVLSLATLVGFLPQAILGPFIGVLIDRYNRKKIMILSDGFIALVTLLLVFVGFYRELPVWLIMIVLFARSIGSTFHTPSLQAVTPLIVPKENLTQCAGYSQTLESISQLLSPAIAAILYGVWSINIILFIDIIGAIIAICTISILKIPTNKKKTDVQSQHAIREAKEGITVLRNEKGMIELMVISALYAVIYMPIGTLYPLICMSYFGGSIAQSSIIEIVFAFGTLLGSIVLGKIGERIDKIGAILKSIGVMGIGLVLTGLLPPSGFKIFTVLATMMGITIPFYYGILTSIYQIKIKSEYLGRVLSLSTSLSMVAMPIGLILSGTFAEVIGVENWFLISGILAILISIVGAMLPTLRNCCKLEK